MLTITKKDNSPAAVDWCAVSARARKDINRLDHAGDNLARPVNTRKRGMGKNHHGKGVKGI